MYIQSFWLDGRVRWVYEHYSEVSDLWSNWCQCHVNHSISSGLLSKWVNEWRHIASEAHTTLWSCCSNINVVSSDYLNRLHDKSCCLRWSSWLPQTRVLRQKLGLGRWGGGFYRLLHRSFDVMIFYSTVYCRSGTIEVAASSRQWSTCSICRARGFAVSVVAAGRVVDVRA